MDGTARQLSRPCNHPGLARLATTFYLKDDLGLSPAESAALSGIFSIPWLLKVCA